MELKLSLKKIEIDSMSMNFLSNLCVLALVW
jgi:hypothetical protein